MANRLIGYIYNCWMFNDSLAGVNGQPFQIPSPAYEPAKFGNGLRMNGLAASVGPAIGSAMPTGPFGWTIALWFKPSSNNFGSFVLNNQNGFLGGFELIHNGNGILLLTVRIANNAAVAILNPTVLSLTDFNLVIFGYDPITRKSFLRINDVQADYIDTFDVPVGLSANLTVGARPIMSGTPCDGIINMLTVWNSRCLNASDMQLLWNGGYGLNYPFTV